MTVLDPRRDGRQSTTDRVAKSRLALTSIPLAELDERGMAVRQKGNHTVGEGPRGEAIAGEILANE